MAESIAGWFAWHERWAEDVSPDDEPVERQAPWDLRGENVRIPPRGRRSGQPEAAGKHAGAAGTPRRGPAAGRGSGGGRSPSAQSARTTSRQAASKLPAKAPVPVPSPLGMRIRAAAQAHPQLGVKRLAAELRAKGIMVTKAQVAQVLASMTKPPKPPAQRRRSVPKRVVPKQRAAQPKPPRMSAAALEKLTPVCPGCGVRVNLNAMCRCS